MTPDSRLGYFLRAVIHAPGEYQLSYVMILGKMILLRCGLSDVVLNVPSIRSAPLISLPAPAPGDMTLTPLTGSSNIDKMRNSLSRFEVLLL